MTTARMTISITRPVSAKSVRRRSTSGWWVPPHLYGVPPCPRRLRSRRCDAHGAMETRGLEPVPDAERTGRVRALFPTWVAANMSVLLLTMGAGLDRLQRPELLAGAGRGRSPRPSCRYGIVGLISIAGEAGRCARHGAVAGRLRPARQPFPRGADLGGPLGLGDHQRGHRRLRGADRPRPALRRAVEHAPRSSSSPCCSSSTCTFLVSGLGINALRVCSKWSTYLFGGFSRPRPRPIWSRTTDWCGGLRAEPAGPTSMMIAGIGTIAAGGISWVPSGPDFTRYLPAATASSRAMVAHRRSAAPGSSSCRWC